MSDKTHIEWTDATWNPVTGCSKVSAGCKHCYAERDWVRLSANSQTRYFGRAFTDVQCHADVLDLPERWQRPRRIFVNSMSDLFHDAVLDEFIDEVFAAMARSPQHVFQVLTKRPARMLAYLSQAELQVRDLVKYEPAAMAMLWPLPNVWLGVSVEDQATADERIPLLLQTPAAVRWISAEPLLGAVDLRHLNKDREINEIDTLQPWTWEQEVEAWRGTSDDWEEDFEDWHGGLTVAEVKGPCHNKIDWVVVGGESGPHARPMNPAWARSLRDQCAADGVPFLFKQWGEWASFSKNDPEHAEVIVGRFGEFIGDQFLHDQLSEQWPSTPMHRAGKKAAGRLLDGIEHNGYPGAVA